MMDVLWSVKGGAGATVCAAALAAEAVDRAVDHRSGAPGRRGGVTLVDLAGDLPAVLGLSESTCTPGVFDWLDGADRSVDALGRLLVDCGPKLTLLPRGAAAGTSTDRIGDLVGWLRSQPGRVVVDAGRSFAPGVSPLHDQLVQALLDHGRSWLVTRACYLSLRRATSSGARLDGVVLIEEPGRALDHRDVRSVLSADVVARVESDPAVARNVDAGLLGHRRPRGLVRSLGVLL